METAWSLYGSEIFLKDLDTGLRESPVAPLSTQASRKVCAQTYVNLVSITRPCAFDIAEPKLYRQYADRCPLVVPTDIRAYLWLTAV